MRFLLEEIKKVIWLKTKAVPATVSLVITITICSILLPLSNIDGKAE